MTDINAADEKEGSYVLSFIDNVTLPVIGDSIVHIWRHQTSSFHMYEGGGGGLVGCSVFILILIIIYSTWHRHSAKAKTKKGHVASN
jgi:hypothetical protein